ncbi:sensor histidine kinase [Massilia sp. 9096]|uniref:sensor histidine kinase n=1 Tax=Massilia sp. 9096 TaxID=1500894 RepID=UPI00068AB211|nr:sensor histidine kinase [Massilia sp. 9096]
MPFRTSTFPKPRGLAGYMALAFTLLSVLLTFIIVAVVERKTTEHVEQTIGRGLAELAVQTVDKLDRGMYERYREIALLARRRELGDETRSIEARRELLDDVLTSYRYYGWIGLAGLDGKVEVAGNGLLEGADVSQRPWFGNALRGLHVGDVHEAKLLYRLLAPQAKEPMRFVDVAFPYLGRDGKPRGVVGAHLSWAWAKDVQQSIIAPLEASRKVDAMIVDARGKVLLGPPGLQGTRLPASAMGQLANRDRGFEQQMWPDGQHYLVGMAGSQGYADYPGLGWKVLVRENLDTALAPVQLLRRYALASGVGLALLFSVAGAFVARWITRPLNRLAGAARNLREDDDQLIDGGASSYEEVRELAASLNRLVRDLVLRRADVEKLNATLERRVADRTLELAAALDEVKAGADRVRDIIEIAQDGYVAVDLDGAIVDWNSQAATMFGWRREEALGQPVARLVPERFRDSVRRSLSQFVATGTLGVLGRRVERIVCDRDGAEFTVELTINLVGSGPRPFFSIFLHDISLRKKVERMKNEFIGTVSHELRTPLTSMRVSLSLLAQGNVGQLDPEAQELADIAHRHCERLVRLVDDMLDIQKIEAGVLGLRTSQHLLLPMVQEAAGAMRGLGRDRSIVVSCASAGGCAELAAEIDYDRMLQVLTNLLSNAIKFSPPGSKVDITVAANAGGARISVADHGRGIPAPFRERVFSRFAHHGSGGGSGLGLSICKGIVEEHGGRIGFVSEEGKGTTFHIDLPASAVKAVPAAAPGVPHVAA